MKTVYENEILFCRESGIAITSPLLDCAGLFIYDKVARAGTLAHWQDRSIENRLKESLLDMNLTNSYAIIAGCGMPVECLSLNDSKTYCEVREFLNSLKIKINDQKVGLDREVSLKVDFSNGIYTIT